MSNDPKETDIDETPEYPLPSPTDSLRRDQRPPDDDDDVEPESDDNVNKTSKTKEIDGPENREG
ncbi:hypothetical protein EMIT0P12_20693 [Pseudomonas sp. IT-P12]|uniref:hypothetical protein n=1 Tax=Pseudomonas sp. IT-P12 TaxID=3026450 RepID=UPI0039E1642F